MLGQKREGKGRRNKFWEDTVDKVAFRAGLEWRVDLRCTVRAQRRGETGLGTSASAIEKPDSTRGHARWGSAVRCTVAVAYGAASAGRTGVIQALPPCLAAPAPLRTDVR